MGWERITAKVSKFLNADRVKPDDRSPGFVERAGADARSYEQLSPGRKLWYGVRDTWEFLKDPPSGI